MSLPKGPAACIHRMQAAFGCRKSGLRHFFEVFIAPLRLRRGQGAMQGNPCYARLFADLPYTPPNPIITSGGCGPRTPGGFSTDCGRLHPQDAGGFSFAGGGFRFTQLPWESGRARKAHPPRAAVAGRGAAGAHSAHNAGAWAFGPRTCVGLAARGQKPPGRQTPPPPPGHRRPWGAPARPNA